MAETNETPNDPERPGTAESAEAEEDKAEGAMPVVAKRKKRAVLSLEDSAALAMAISDEGHEERCMQREKARKYSNMAENLTEKERDEIAKLVELTESTEGAEEPDWLAKHRLELRVYVKTMDDILTRQMIRKGDGWPGGAVGQFRKYLIQTMELPLFDQFIMVAILVNCVFMAIADPTVDEAADYQVTASYIFLGIFTWEALVKFGALGKLYFFDAWNWLDMVVVVEGWVSALGDGGSALAGLKTFRILRPLRVANRVPSVKMLVTALVKAMPSIMDTILVFFFFLLIMAMLCNTLFMGSWDYRCFDDESGDEIEDGELCFPKIPKSGEAFCDGLSFLDSPYQCEKGESCLFVDETPEGGGVNFDNILYGMLTLFSACTVEGWSSTMYYAQSTMNWYLGGFIFVFIVIMGNFTILNIMIAGILTQLGDTESLEEELRIEFEMAKGKREDERKARDAAREEAVSRGEPVPPLPMGEQIGNALSKLFDALYGCTNKVLTTVCYQGLPKEPEESFGARARSFAMADESPFSLSIQGCILFNMLILALDSYEAGRGDDGEEVGGMGAFLFGANLVLTYIFIFEMALKHVVIGLLDYWSDPWCIFDGIIVLGSILDLVAEAQGEESGTNLGFLRVLRLTRVLRLARLINKWQSLKEVMARIVSSINKMGPVGLLLLLFMFIFTILGMQTFGNYPVDDEINFIDFKRAFVNVFFALIGEGWVDIMYGTMQEAGAPAALYFVLIILIGNFILMNLILAVVLGGAAVDAEVKKQLGIMEIQKTIALHSKSLALDRWCWHTAKSRLVAFRAGTLVAWHWLLEKHGSDRFFKLAANLGLRDAIHDGLQEHLALGVQAREISLAAAEIASQRLGIDIPLDRVAPGASKESGVNHLVCVEGVDKFDQVINTFDEFKWLNLAKSSKLVADFCTEHLPTGYVSEREGGKDGALKFVKSEDGDEKYATADQMKLAETIFGTLNNPKLDKPPKKKKPLANRNLDSVQRMKQAEAVDESSAGKKSPRSLLEDEVIIATGTQRKWLAFRKFSMEVTDSHLWHDVMMKVILVSCFMIIITDDSTPWVDWRTLIDLACNLLFIAELGLMVGAANVEVAHEDAEGKQLPSTYITGFSGYWANPWNRLDFLIVLSSIFSPIFRVTNNDIGYALCALVRACRPLRIMTHVALIKEQVVMLVTSFSGLGTLAVFLAFSMSAYAIVGMQLLKGLYQFCDDEDDPFPFNKPFAGDIDEATGRYKSRPCSSADLPGGTYTNMDGEVLVAAGEMANSDYHFDDFLSALLTVYILSTEGWWSIVHEGISATTLNHSRKPYGNQNVLVWVYLAFAICFFSLYMLNEFVGVVFDTYVELKAQTENEKHMKPAEMDMNSWQESISRLRPVVRHPRPNAKWRQSVYKMIEGPAATNFILSVIALNAVTLAAMYKGQPGWMDDTIDWCNLVFAVIFTVEAALKLIGSGPRIYFESGMNVFDFTVTATSLIDSVLFVISQCGEARRKSTFLRLVGSMRVLRLMKLMLLYEGCEVIMLTCNYAWPRLVTVCQLLGILIFWFANIGVVLFGDYPGTGSLYANFENEIYCMTILFVLITCDNWNDSMGGMVAYNEDRAWMVIAFYLIYMVAMAFIIVNLFVMVVCEAFEVLDDETKKAMLRSAPQYTEAWSMVDPEATGEIPPQSIERLLRTLPAPFGMPFPDTGDAEEIRTFYKALPVKCEFIRAHLTDGKASFHEVYFLLVCLYSFDAGSVTIKQYTRELNELNVSILLTSRARIWIAKARTKKIKLKVQQDALTAPPKNFGSPKSGLSPKAQAKEADFPDGNAGGGEGGGPTPVTTAAGKEVFVI